MSLLMDALRRAEADKKAQEERAARAAGGDPITRMSHYSNSQDDTVQIDGRALQAAAATMADFDLRIDDNLDRSLSMTMPEGMSLEPLEGAAVNANATNFGVVGPRHDHHEEHDDGSANATYAGRAARREQTATLPNSRGLADDLDDYFDRPEVADASRRAAPGEDGTLDDVAAHTVVGAQTIFRAGERTRSGRLLMWVAGVAICAVLGIAGLGVYYAGLSPTPHVVPSPEVARDVEKPSPHQRALAPPGAPQSAAGNELARIDTETLPAPDAVPTHASQATHEADVASVPTAQQAEQASLALTSPPGPAPVSTPIKARPPAVPRAMLASTPRAVSEEINAGEVQISRGQRPSNVDAALNKAYAAFQAGDLDTAAKLYNSARIAEPGRRDTLLGLAAVALQRSDLPRAYAYYAEVLKRYPADPVASAALFNMTEAEGEGGAARLRLLLDDHADAAYIHAALGNWYARRGRWPDAQQAYFDAARLDVANPDYAFNLAVSLEHLGQGTAARDYYQKSLALRATRGAGFNPQAAHERIQALAASATARVP